MKYIDSINKFKEYSFNNLLDYKLFNKFESNDFYKYLKLEYKIYLLKQDMILKLKQSNYIADIFLHYLYNNYKNKISKQNKILDKYDLVKEKINLVK